MLKKLLLLCTLSISTLSFATTIPTFTNNQTPIRVQQNETFNIQLQSNPTTGYSWQWAKNKFDANLIQLVSHKFIAPQNKKMVGAPGYELWTFKAKPGNYAVTQVGHIVMEYKRPWEKTSGELKTFTIYVK